MILLDLKVGYYYL